MPFFIPKDHINIFYITILLLFFSALPANPVLINTTYSVNSNVISLEFSEFVRTDTVNYNLILFDDGQNELIMSGGNVISDDLLSGIIEINLIYGAVIDERTYNYDSFYYWGNTKDLVNSFENLDMNNLFITVYSGAFVNQLYEPCLENNPIMVDITNVTDNHPIVESVVYETGFNALHVFFDRPVQFDQLAEDRTCNNGQGDCPGNGWLDGNPNEDINGNGVLDMESNIDVSNIIITSSIGFLRLENYTLVIQNEDNNEITIILDWLTAGTLEQFILSEDAQIQLEKGAFYDVQYNPNEIQEIPLTVEPDPMPLQLTNATYEPADNEFRLYFENSRDVDVINFLPVYSKISISDGDNSISLNGIRGNSLVSQGTTLMLRELLFSDQSQIEQFMMNAGNSGLSLELDDCAVHDLNGNGNIQSSSTLTLIGDYDEPTISDVSYESDLNRLVLNWDPDRISYLGSELITLEPQTIEIEGVSITNSTNVEILEVLTADLSRNSTKRKTFLDLPGLYAQWIETTVNNGDNIEISILPYTFFESGSTNNNGNFLIAENLIDYTPDISGPIIETVKIDNTLKEIILNFDENILFSLITFDTAEIFINDNLIIFDDLILINENDEGSSLHFQINNSEYSEFIESIPLNQYTEMTMALPTEAFINLDNVLGLPCFDENANNICEEFEAITVDVSFGSEFWNESHRSFAESPTQMFASQKYASDSFSIFVEESIWSGFCIETDTGVHPYDIYQDILTSEACAALPHNSNHNPVWAQLFEEDVQLIADFFSTHKPVLENTYGDLQDINEDGKLDIVLYDIVDEYIRGSNDTNSSLFTHGYHTQFTEEDLDPNVEPQVNVGEMLFIDVFPQILITDGQSEDFASMYNAIVHEYTKLLISQNEPDEEDWLKEGLAFFEQKRLLNDVKFFGDGTGIMTPSANQLTHIGFSKKSRTDQYNIYLFLTYLFEKYTNTDGWDVIDAIAYDQTYQGMNSIDFMLSTLGSPDTVEEVFMNYATACLLDIEQQDGIYNGIYSLDSADLFGALSGKNMRILAFTETHPPPYKIFDMLPWSFYYYLIRGLSISMIDNSLYFSSPLLDPSDTLRFVGIQNINYLTNKVMLKNGFTAPIDPLYEVVPFNIDQVTSMGSLPISTNTIEGENFTFQYIYGECSDGYSPTVEDCCLNNGGSWDGDSCSGETEIWT